MKAKPCKLERGLGYVQCHIDNATHVLIHIPGPTGLLTLPVIRSGNQQDSRSWLWNGDTEKPTLSPSVLTTFTSGIDNKSWRCHSFITDGAAQFLGDCTHSLAGTTVPLLDVDILPIVNDGPLARNSSNG